MKDYYVMTDGRNFFDQPTNSMNKTYENSRKIATGKGDDYTTGCPLDYPYFKENYKMIAIDLSRPDELDADPRAIQQINFRANLDRAGNVVIRLSPNMIGDSNDKTNFPHELLLTKRQVSSIRKAFANNSSIDIKFSKTQLSKMIQSGEFLG